MAKSTIIIDGLALFSRVASVVAAETPRVIIMSQVIRICSPGDLQERKHILAINRAKGLRSVFDLGAILAPDVWIIGAIEVLKADGDL